MSDQDQTPAEPPSDDQPNRVWEYTSEDLQHLSDLEHVRERPAMYIGDTTGRGLHHLVYEVVDNSIDEAMAGYAQTVNVIINTDGSVTVEDDGRGIPVDRHEQLSEELGRDVSTVTRKPPSSRSSVDMAARTIGLADSAWSRASSGWAALADITITQAERPAPHASRQ